MKSDHANILSSATEKLLVELKPIYVTTQKQNLRASDVNRLLHRDYKYLISTRGKTGILGLLAALLTPSNAQTQFLNLSREIFHIISTLRQLWPCSMTLRDLDEHNLLYNEETNVIKAVDMEDAEWGHPVFDLTYFTSRMCLSDNPISTANSIMPSIENFLTEIYPVNSTELCLIYRKMTAMHLIVAAMNPWLWPSKSTFVLDKMPLWERVCWLRNLWKLINSL